jgi:hypothetical protein
VVRWWRDEGRPHLQAARVARLIAAATDERDVAWIIHGDADEFWMPTAGSLRDVFDALPERCRYIEVAREEFLPVADTTAPFHQRMVIRYRQSCNLRGDCLEPKIAQRPTAGGTIAPGNPVLRDPALARGPVFGALSVLHFPARTPEQFERKVLRNGIGHEVNPDREPGVGCDQLRLLALQRAGGLRAHYDALVERAERFAAGGDDPDLDAQGEQLGADLAAVRAERDRLAEAVDEVTWERDRLAHTLEVVRASATMRYTAPARRVYYRLRGPS